MVDVTYIIINYNYYNGDDLILKGCNYYYYFHYNIHNYILTNQYNLGECLTDDDTVFGIGKFEQLN